MVQTRENSSRQTESKSQTRNQTARIQDSAYLIAATQAGKAASSLDYGTNSRENARQHSLAEVVKGQGRAVYALEDQNRIVKELNAAFGIKDGDRFHTKLHARIKDFQREMIEKDPTWKELESKLKPQGKTLVDGLVGPMTVKAMVEKGVVKFDPKQGLVAGQQQQQQQQQQQNIRQEEQKKPPQNIRPVEQKKPEEIKKLEPKKEEPLKEDQKIVKARNELEALKKQYEKLEVERKAASQELEAAAPELKAKRDAITAIKQSKSASGFLTLKNTYSFDSLGSNSSFNTDTLKKDAADILERQKTTAQAIAKIEKALGEPGKAAAKQDRLEISEINKILSISNRAIKEDQQSLRLIKSSLSMLTNFTNDEYINTNKSWAEIQKKEAEVIANLEKGDPTTTKKYTEQAMSWVKEPRYDNQDRKDAELGFAGSFSKDPAKALKLYRTIESSHTNRMVRRGMEFGLQYGKNLDKFIGNLEKSLETESINTSEKAQISKYIETLKKCGSLGIDHPVRFTPQNLIKIVEERENPQTDKKLLVITAAKSDHNSAFHVLDKVASKFMAQGYRVQYHEVATDAQVVEALSKATQNGNFKADAFCLSGHGSKTQISLSDSDPRFSNIANSERVIDLTDSNKLQAANKYLKLDQQNPNDNVKIIVNSCSTGEGEKEGETINNIANFLRSVFPNAAPKAIFAPVSPANIWDIKFDKGSPSGIESVDENGRDIKTYQAKFKKDKDPLALVA